MLDGEMVNTGGCNLRMENAKGSEEAPINVGDGENSINGVCELKEGDV